MSGHGLTWAIAHFGALHQRRFRATMTTGRYFANYAFAAPSRRTRMNSAPHRLSKRISAL